MAKVHGRPTCRAAHAHTPPPGRPAHRAGSLQVGRRRDLASELDIPIGAREERPSDVGELVHGAGRSRGGGLRRRWCTALSTLAAVRGVVGRRRPFAAPGDHWGQDVGVDGGSAVCSAAPGGPLAMCQWVWGGLRTRRRHAGLLGRKRESRSGRRQRRSVCCSSAVLL